MKIHKSVNPVAYENTYYLEGEQHLIVVDPGSHWAVSYTHLGRHPEIQSRDKQTDQHLSQ